MKSSTDHVLGSPVHPAASSCNHLRLTEERLAACRRRLMEPLLPTGDLLAGWGFGDLLSFLIVDGAQFKIRYNCDIYPVKKHVGN